jgi:hypothetical protein
MSEESALAEPGHWDFQNKLNHDTHGWLISLITLVRQQVGEDPWYNPQGLAGDRAAQQANVMFFKGIERYTATCISHTDDPRVRESSRLLQQLVSHDEHGNPLKVEPTEEMFADVKNPTFAWDQYNNPSWEGVVRHIIGTVASLG